MQSEACQTDSCANKWLQPYRRIHWVVYFFNSRYAYGCNLYQIQIQWTALWFQTGEIHSQINPHPFLVKDTDLQQQQKKEKIYECYKTSTALIADSEVPNFTINLITFYGRIQFFFSRVCVLMCRMSSLVVVQCFVRYATNPFTWVQLPATANIGGKWHLHHRGWLGLTRGPGAVCNHRCWGDRSIRAGRTWCALRTLAPAVCTGDLYVCVREWSHLHARVCLHEPCECTSSIVHVRIRECACAWLRASACTSVRAQACARAWLVVCSG